MTGDDNPQDHKVEGHQALTPDQERARKGRSLAIGLALGAFVLLVFLITVARLGSNIAGGAAG